MLNGLHSLPGKSRPARTVALINFSAEELFGRTNFRPKNYSAEKLIRPTVLAERDFPGKLCKSFNTRNGVNFYLSAEKTNIRPKRFTLFRPKILLVRPKESKIRFRKRICHGIDTQLHDFTPIYTLNHILYNCGNYLLIIW